MGWTDAISSGYDDARRRLEALENEASSAIERAKTGVTQAATTVADRARAATSDPPEPSQAVLDQSSAAAADFAKNSQASLPSMAAPRIPRMPSLPAPPSVVPAVGEEGSTAEKVRPYVMIGAGFGTAYVTGHLGPAGGVAQYAIDAAVEKLGTAQDKFNFGYGQMGGALVNAAQGAAMTSEGGTVEVSTGGLATPVAIPVAFVGVVQVAVATSQVVGAQALMSSGPVAPSAGAAAVAPKGFASDGLLDGHVNKHANEWNPPPTREEYLRNAKALLEKQPGGEVQGHVRKNGEICRYNTKTNELAVMRPDGTIKTYFRPTDGVDYWKDELKK